MTQNPVARQKSTAAKARADVLTEVRAALRDQGRTQVWLAAKVSEALDGEPISRWRMAHWLDGSSRMPREAFERMCAELHLSVRLMLRGIPEGVLLRQSQK